MNLFKFRNRVLFVTDFHIWNIILPCFSINPPFLLAFSRIKSILYKSSISRRKCHLSTIFLYILPLLGGRGCCYWTECVGGEGAKGTFCPASAVPGTMSVYVIGIKGDAEAFWGTSHQHWWSRRGILEAWFPRGSSSLVTMNIHFYFLKVVFSADSPPTPHLGKF